MKGLANDCHFQEGALSKGSHDALVENFTCNSPGLMWQTS